MGEQSVSPDFLLDFWENIATFHDTHGLPLDIMYLRLSEEGFVMDRQQFRKNAEEAIQIVQAGGWRAVRDGISRKMNDATKQKTT